MKGFKLKLSQEHDRIALKAAGAVIDGNFAIFKGISEEWAADIVSKAIPGSASDFSAKALARKPDDSDKAAIRARVGDVSNIEDYVIVEMVATTTAPDSFRERIERSFMEYVLMPAYKSGTALLFNHDLNFSIGQTFDAAIESNGTVDSLKVKAFVTPTSLLPSGQLAKDAISEGSIPMCSIAWFSNSTTWKIVESNGKNIISNYFTPGESEPVRVRELSATPCGAHEAAKLNRKNIEFIPIVENMENIKLKIAGKDEDLTPEQVQAKIAEFETAAAATVAKVASLEATVKAAKAAPIERIQSLEISLKQKNLDEAGLIAQRTQLEAKSFEELNERITELVAMEKALGGKNPLTEIENQGKIKDF